MGDGTNPRVFLSHANDDKARFVMAFGERLRLKGVDVWLDRWEIYPGDSLVDKIFEEGLKDAAAVIIVLSANSVDKKWVREELNASVVARIARGTRLIPIVLDDVEVPVALRSTVWVKIDDLNAYDEALERIVASIFDFRPKPMLGHPPEYTQATFELSGLSKRDAHVLKLFCDGAVRKDSLLVVNTDETAVGAQGLGIGREQFLESAIILEEQGYLKKAEIMAPVPPFYSITLSGFDKYVHAYVPGYDSLVGSVASEIVNRDNHYNQDIMKALGRSDFVVVDHIMNVMERKGLIKLSKCIGHHTYVHDFSPRLRRMLEA